MNEVTLELVLQQIAKDVESGDMTAIAELIADIPEKKGLAFLPDVYASKDSLEGL